MFLTTKSSIACLKTQYRELCDNPSNGSIDPDLKDACDAIYGKDDIMTYACCQSHIGDEEYPEYGSQFYVAVRVSTATAAMWWHSVFARFAKQLRLHVTNPYSQSDEWVNPRLEIDETCDELGNDREWSMAIRVTVCSEEHQKLVCNEFTKVVNSNS